MKKICMVAYTYYLNDPRVCREAEALLRQGMRVDCFCLREKGYCKQEVVNGVHIYRLPLRKYRGSSTIKYISAYILFLLLTFFAVSFFYIKRRYSVIQFHTLPDFIIFAGIIPKICGAKLILDMHEITPELFMLKFAMDVSHPFVKILKLVEGISIRLSDAVIVVADPVKRLLLQRYKSKLDVTVVMNCADDRLFCHDSLPTYGSANGFSLMYHGTLTQLYGLEFAIRAVAKLKDRIPNLEFHIFGNEEEAIGLKKLVEELDVERNVIFMGRVSRTEVPRYLKQTDIGVIPTIRGEFTDLTFSNKLTEFVCMKKPVITTRLKPALEYFPEDAISYFESRNVDELASKILDLYMNPQKRLCQAEKAFQHYQKIRWEIMRRRYVELIKSLVGT